MHFSHLSFCLLAFATPLISARFYPRSDLDLAEDDFEDDGYDVEEHHLYSPQQQPLYELFPDQLAQNQQQQRHFLKSHSRQTPHQSYPLSNIAHLQHLRARTNAAYYQQKGIASSNQCKKVADCKCPNAKATNACISGKCSCGNAELGKIGNAFAKPILEGVKKIGDGLDKVVNDTAWALKQALKIGSWLIPGVGKTAAKVLDAAIPQTKLKTGNVKADEVLNALSKVI